MIEQIVIENYKSISSAKIVLKNLNVLIGSNGAGKSNFISFFELLRQMYNQRLSLYVAEQGGIDRLLYQGLKHSDYIKGLVDFDNKNAFFFKLKPSVSNKAYIEYSGDYFNGNYDSEYDKDYEKWHQVLWDKAIEESDMVNRTEYRADYIKKYLKGFLVYHFHDSSKTSLLRKSCLVNDNIYLREDGSNLAAFLYRLQETDLKTFRLIQGVVKSIAPYFKCFKLSPDRNNNNMITLEWEEVDSDMYLDANSFSDGTIRFIALVTLLLQPNMPDTIIIDEPELGLHPAAIHKIGALISRAALKTQVIVATQSMNLVDCFEPENVVAVDRKDRQTVFNRLDGKDLSNWLDAYSLGEIWEKNVIGGQP